MSISLKEFSTNAARKDVSSHFCSQLHEIDVNMAVVSARKYFCTTGGQAVRAEFKIAYFN